MHVHDYPKILVVNDDPASLLALTSLLDAWAEELRYQVIAASSGRDALRQVLQHDFAVILLDVNMPEMNGFETADAIKQRSRSADIPIIFVTAYQADEIARVQAYQHGAADFLFTPLIPQVLRAKVSVFITLAQKNEELRSQATKLSQRTDDLTAINGRLTREMEERRAAERANHAKDEFLAMLGHELRNPLAAISSAVSLLGMPATTTATALRAREIIERQARQLGSIVDDLLDLSRVMSGKIKLERQPINLSDVISTCVGIFKTRGRTADHVLTETLSPCWVEGDPTRLEQIATNLIDNAIKYTPPGKNIHIVVEKDVNDVVLTVSDNGVGITPDLLPYVFDTFVQQESSLDRAQGGLGIGLSLVRRLVELHSGTVSVNSAGPGLGSTFTVRLPWIAAAEAPPVSPGERRDGGEMRLLLIDDNNDAREMLALALDAYGYKVDQAECGVRGVMSAQANLPRIAVIDIGLPTIDGYEVARRLRQNPATSNIRLVALTGYGSATDQALALDAGFDLHLTKPVVVDTLHEIISDLCAIESLGSDRMSTSG